MSINVKTLALVLQMQAPDAEITTENKVIEGLLGALKEATEPYDIQKRIMLARYYSKVIAYSKSKDYSKTTEYGKYIKTISGPAEKAKPPYTKILEGPRKGR